MGEESVIALVDPDFVFLRPLDGRVRGANNSIYSSSYKPADMDFDYVTKVLRGKETLLLALKAD